MARRVAIKPESLRKVRKGYQPKHGSCGVIRNQEGEAARKRLKRQAPR